MITGKTLKKRGWKEGRTIGLAKTAATELEKRGLDESQIFARLDEVLAAPQAFLGDAVFTTLADELIRRERNEQSKFDDALRSTPIPFQIWGEEGIDAGAIEQMNNAALLPISVAGALMPDAHIGYGLPIGGVLATRGAVIPYAVGVDIACFAGDTRVPVADGRDYSLRELSERDEPFVVFCSTPSGRVCAALATAHQTKRGARLVEVELDNGERVRCTPDHEWMLRDGSFAPARALCAGTSLMPFYSKRDRENYTLVQQNYSGYWQRAHWLIARSGLLGEIPNFEGQKTVIHHRNFDESDNRPENLQFLGDGEHARLHRDLVERNTHWQSAQFEAARVAALSAKAQTPEGHAFYAARGSANLKSYWQNDYERARANCAGNGQRGREFLVAKNQSEAGRARSREISNRFYTCETCGEEVRSPIGLHNHRRHQHGYNHQVVAVREVGEREDVFCLNVPGFENFALSSGVFVHNCRMRLSIYEVSPHVLGQQKNKFENTLRDQTRFGAGKVWGRHERKEHDVLDDPDWNSFGLLRKLRYKAEEQLGTSGSGNHFVEWGELEVTEHSPELGLAEGRYLALLSHSGSRGVGFQIANLYSRHANSLHPQLADKVKHLAWLDLDSEAGLEYWLAMELAGRFAQANHFIIHHEVAKVAGLKEIAAVENHHNFAWKEVLADGEEAIVHRKGATPAGQGVLGVIPGSMADAGYVVRGKGLNASLKSASHGAGRKLGRKAAINSITKLQRDRYVQERGVKVLGGGLDEAPQAYKDIEEVIAAQRDLVDVLAKFSPKIVMMADEKGDV